MGGRILQRNKSENGSSFIINGWKAAGIYDAVKAGSSGLQSIDPFKDSSPLVSPNMMN